MEIYSKLARSLSMTGGSLFFALLACAYLDPGSGSMLIQALIAALAAGGVFIGMFWSRIRGFFQQILGKSKIKPEESVNEN